MTDKSILYNKDIDYRTIYSIQYNSLSIFIFGNYLVTKLSNQ